MLKKRRENGFNLAFLDVMACGLGAVLLILIIVNFNDDTPIPVDEIEKLEQELNASKSQAQALLSSISDKAIQTEQQQSVTEESDQQVAKLQIEQQQLNAAIAEQQAVIANLQDAIAAIAPETANDTVELPEVNEETYLLGLVVEGRHIGVLIDTSASMTDESLIEIIKRKLASERVKQAGPKWQRTVAIANWMLARLPNSSKVSVVSYNDSATVLGERNISSASVTANIEALSKDIRNLVPQNGTNLQVGLETLQRAMPNMTDLYIITDGLPSLIDPSSGFSPSRRCNPFKGKQATITGQCRVDVMRRTLAVNSLSGVRTNIVLLPLEGDPQASPLYWQWASFTGGTFISPAGTWP